MKVVLYRRASITLVLCLSAIFLLLLLVFVVNQRHSLLGQGPTLAGGLLGRKVDNTIKSLVFRWQDWHYRRRFKNTLGYALPLPPPEPQTGVPVLLHSYLAESLYRAKTRHELQAKIPSTCPQCLIYPMVGPWYQSKPPSVPFTENENLVTIPFQESEMEEWMVRHFLDDPPKNTTKSHEKDTSSLSFWELYQSMSHTTDRVQFASLLVTLVHGGVFLGRHYYYNATDDDDDRQQPTHSMQITMTAGPRSMDILSVIIMTNPLDCVLDRLRTAVMAWTRSSFTKTTTTTTGRVWPTLMRHFYQACQKSPCRHGHDELRIKLVKVNNNNNNNKLNEWDSHDAAVPPATAEIVPVFTPTSKRASDKKPKHNELVRTKCRAGWFCHRCLRLPWRGSIHACRWVCHSCYTDVITLFQPGYQDVTFELTMDSSSSSSSSLWPMRNIPRIIHQTWFEPVHDALRYPHLNRLQNSWKALPGWDYRFYTDDSARDYIVTYYPSRFVHAYDAILPGAFKADFFRLLVLLREGGVYADMDVQLDTDLDSFLEAHIEFFVPRDCPIDRWPNSNYCLWNGFMGSVPGHPILVQAVEDIMNNVLNRFDYYDVEGALVRSDARTEVWKLRSIPILLLTGPCALGISVNKASKTPNLLRGFPVGWLPEMEGVLLLHTDRYDSGELRFTDMDRNLLVASTNADAMARNPTIVEDDKQDTVGKKESAHYSKSESEIVGAHGVYKDHISANERIVIPLQG